MRLLSVSVIEKPSITAVRFFLNPELTFAWFINMTFLL